MFAVGDLVVCVPKGGSCPALERHLAGAGPEVLVVGRMYRITEARVGRLCAWNIRVEGVSPTGINITNGRPKSWFCHTRFRKIDAASDEFARQMRAIKPRREPVNA